MQLVFVSVLWCCHTPRTVFLRQNQSMFALVLVSRNLCAIKPTFVVILSTLHGIWHRVRISYFMSNHYMILVTRQSTLVFPIFAGMRQFSGNIRKVTSETRKRTSVSSLKRILTEAFESLVFNCFLSLSRIRQNSEYFYIFLDSNFSNVGLLRRAIKDLPFFDITNFGLV